MTEQRCPTCSQRVRSETVYPNLGLGRLAGVDAEEVTRLLAEVRRLQEVERLVKEDRCADEEYRKLRAKYDIRRPLSPLVADLLSDAAVRANDARAALDRALAKRDQQPSTTPA